MEEGREMGLRADKRRNWEQHITAWARGNLSQTAYCREHGLSYSLFGYWKRQLHRPARNEVKLVPIGMPYAYLQPVNRAAPLRLIIDARYPGGDTARFR